MDQLENDNISDENKRMLRSNYAFIMKRLNCLYNKVTQQSLSDDQIKGLIGTLRGHEMNFKMFCKQHEQLRIKFQKKEKGILAKLWSCMTFGCF